MLHLQLWKCIAFTLDLIMDPPYFSYIWKFVLYRSPCCWNGYALLQFCFHMAINWFCRSIFCLPLTNVKWQVDVYTLVPQCTLFCMNLFLQSNKYWMVFGSIQAHLNFKCMIFLKIVKTVYISMYCYNVFWKYRWGKNQLAFDICKS